MTLPNFFILGGPKCGTTAMADYLRDHPNVFMSVPKEPHYFATDFPSRRLVTTAEDYERLFAKATDQHQAVGEASVHYLRSADAVPAILEKIPDAKLIAMVRNPVDFIASWHGQQIRNFDEDEKDLAKAWELRHERRLGRHIGPDCPDPTFLDYELMARFGEQLTRLYQHASPEQVLLISFEDFKQDTRAAYQRVLQFLGLPDDQKDDFPVINRRREYRSPAFARITKGLYKATRSIRRAGREAGLTGWLSPLTHRVFKMNAVYTGKPDLAPDLVEEIKRTLADDTQRMQEVLQRVKGDSPL